MTPTIALCFAALATTACASHSDRPAVAQPKVDPATAPAARPVTTANDRHATAQADSVFAMDAYAVLRKTPGNLAFSPFSISVALAMTYAGARGETAQQIRKALHFELPDDALHAAYGAQLAGWNDAAPTAYQLRIVNRLFGEQTATFETPFLDITAGPYDAPLEPVDFIRSPEPSRSRINQWVAGQTQDKIKDLLPPGSIDPDSRLVLTNAVYFKGSWETEFDKSLTEPADFHRLEGAAVSVPTMQLTADLGYAKVGDVEVLEMPYAGGELAMTFLLPGNPQALAAMETQLTTANITRWVGALSKREVEVRLPRLKVDPPAPTKLKPLLSGLGMPLAFSRAADFTGMTGIKSLFIDEVYHKAFVEVNEEGTEAAAATAVVMTTESMTVSTHPRFVADRPFVFLIRDLRSGTVLFMGRVVDPS